MRFSYRLTVSVSALSSSFVSISIMRSSGSRPRGRRCVRGRRTPCFVRSSETFSSLASIYARTAKRFGVYSAMPDIIQSVRRLELICQRSFQNMATRTHMVETWTDPIFRSLLFLFGRSGYTLMTQTVPPQPTTSLSTFSFIATISGGAGVLR